MLNSNKHGIYPTLINVKMPTIVGILTFNESRINTTSAVPNKGITILYWFTCRPLSTVLSPTENRRIQGLFKAFECFSSSYQGRFNFQGLFKKALWTSSTFKTCANPVNQVPKSHELTHMLWFSFQRAPQTVFSWIFRMKKPLLLCQPRVTVTYNFVYNC